ncbi:MAG TPA: hypothetical protein VGP72_24580 [Planctomycetota bacterium]|jgi:hypothetical protein
MSIHKHPEHTGPLLPKMLWAAFAVVVVGGLLLGLTRQSRMVSSLNDAINSCQAEAAAEKDGLRDTYGIVTIVSNESGVTRFLSLCDTNPPLAKQIFRESITSGSKSARLIALYSAWYLAEQNQLEEQDLKAIVACIDPNKGNDEAVRKAAQRTLSDLTVLTNVADASQYEVVPSCTKEPAAEAPPNKIQTRQEKQRRTGQPGLAIRWSNAEVAYCWWQAFSPKGAWDNSLQRFVISAAAPASVPAAPDAGAATQVKGKSANPESGVPNPTPSQAKIQK